MVLAMDSFHPESLAKVIIDKNEISSTDFLGYGVYAGHRCPVVKVIYKDGNVEDVLDEWHLLQK